MCEEPLPLHPGYHAPGCASTHHRRSEAIHNPEWGLDKPPVQMLRGSVRSVRKTPPGRLPALVRACPPEPALAVTALTTALAVSVGRGAGSVTVAAALLSGQLSVGWSNDWIDADRDRRSGRCDKPVARGDLSPTTLRNAALAAVACCVPLSLAMGRAAGLLPPAAVAAAWAYNARLKPPLLSWAPYAFSFGAIPSIVPLGLPGSPWAPRWATAAGALLG